MTDSVIKLRERRPGNLKQRLKGDSFLGDPNYLPPVAPNAPGTPFDYRVSRNESNGNVVISLGSVQPFELPPESAAKMAMLLLKHTGGDAAVNVAIMVLKSAGLIASEEVSDGQE